MAREKGARKIEVDPREDRTEEPRAPQAYSTGEYHFFRRGDTPVPDVTGSALRLPISSGGWMLPVLAVAVLAVMTFLLLR